MSQHAEREQFDAILKDVMDQIPEAVHVLIEEVPVVVDDEPPRELLEEMGMDPEVDDLCGLHSGVALTERSVTDGPDLPETVHLFRGPIMRLAADLADEDSRPYGDHLYEQIRITLLHELGHHFGMDEEDLDALGYA